MMGEEKFTEYVNLSARNMNKGIPTVRRIIEDYLKKHKYDGLMADGCGCLIGDLFYGCDQRACYGSGCVPGYHRPDLCPPECEGVFMSEVVTPPLL